MKILINKKDGSTLILLVITIAVLTVLGASLLSVTMINLKIKKSNTEMRQSFYMSDSGLNTAYVDAYGVVLESYNDSIEKVRDYLEIYPLEQTQVENIFEDNYKTYITLNIKSRINKNFNPVVTIQNEGSLYFIEDKLTIEIVSNYKSENTEKMTACNLIIEIPIYNDIYEVLSGTIQARDIVLSKLLSLKNWDIIR